MKADPHEEWQSWEAVLANGTGDCEDLASAVAAELVAAGVPSRPVAFEARPGLWHVVVEVWVCLLYGGSTRPERAE